MNRAFQLCFLAIFAALFGCGGARLSHKEIRQQISSLGSSTLVPDSVSVRRVVSQSGNRAIAETTVDLAVQFERDSGGKVTAFKVTTGRVRNLRFERQLPDEVEPR